MISKSADFDSSTQRESRFYQKFAVTYLSSMFGVGDRSLVSFGFVLSVVYCMYDAF